MSSPPTPEPLTLDVPELRRRIARAVEQVADVLDIAVDPVSVRRVVRGLAGTSALDRAGTLACFERVLSALGMSAQRVELDPRSLDAIELPVLSIDRPGLAVLRRQGRRFELLEEHGSRDWYGAEALVGHLPAAPLGTWLVAAPAAPMAALRHQAGVGRRLWQLARLERDDLMVVLLFAAGAGLGSLATPIAVQTLVASVAFGTLLQPIVVVSLMLLAALGFQATLQALQARVVEGIKERLLVRTALDLAHRIPRVRRDRLDAGFGPETINRFFEVVGLRKAAGVLLTDGVATVLQVAVGLLVLAFYHPALLAFDVLLVALLVVVLAFPARRAFESSLEESSAKYAIAAWLQTLARRGSVFRSAAGAELATDRADALVRSYLVARRRHFRTLFGQTVGTLAIQVFASAALLGVGGWLVIRTELTLGQLVAAELIVAGVAGAIGKLGKLLERSYELLTSLEKLGHVVDEELDTPVAGEPIPGQGPLEVRAVEASDGALPPVNLQVAAGEHTAVVGPEAHQLAEWLGALRLPQRGLVLFNEVDVRQLCAPRLRESLAMVHADDVFEGTVAENVTLHRPEVSAARVREVLQAVGLLDELRALPDGLDTHLAPGLPVLSEGQVLRLQLARAMAASPRLLVVDDTLEVLPVDLRSRCAAALADPAAPWTLVALVRDPTSTLARACRRTVDHTGAEAHE
ncbi:MAG: ABC transporter ATP-binding protein/permease [Myxococcaceae bacterium]|nr:ABC transporter ATP-binding protein/permease [Myxococcaceae bacterium]